MKSGIRCCLLSISVCTESGLNRFIQKAQYFIKKRMLERENDD